MTHPPQITFTGGQIARPMTGEAFNIQRLFLKNDGWTPAKSSKSDQKLTLIELFMLGQILRDQLGLNDTVRGIQLLEGNKCYIDFYILNLRPTVWIPMAD